LEFDLAHAEIQGRWFVWTAAGLTVHPVTLPEPEDTAPRSLRLRVSRPSAHIDIVLSADGWCDVSVRRPGSDDTVHERAQVESVEAFGLLLDRFVELITWSGALPESGSGTPRGQRSAAWVLGHDGNAGA
jgi:hypothetical protein